MLKRSHTPFGHTLGRSTGWVHRAELARNGVKMLKGVEYRRIDAAGVHIAVEGAETVIAADTIIVCAGQEPQRELMPALVALGRTPQLIGGAREAGELDAKRAMLEGAELATRL
jgi:2,4-dienoyl-CoA reductase (NADPH2)